MRDRRNDYSVPTAYGHREVLVKGDVDAVVIVCGSDEIARHRRSYEREVLIFEPRHDLALLERKPGTREYVQVCCGGSKTFSSTTSAAPSGTPCVWGRSGSMPSSTSCGVASTTGRPTSIWRSIRTCRSPA